MKTINHESYVSLEIAELLKEVGFDWKCINRYIKDIDLIVPSLGEANWNSAKWGINDYKSAPTLEVAQRWLREVKHCEIYALRDTFDCKFYYIGEAHNSKWGNRHFIKCDVDLDTFEEAQEAGIKKALEIILEKKE